MERKYSKLADNKEMGRQILPTGTMMFCDDVNPLLAANVLNSAMYTVYSLHPWASSTITFPLLVGLRMPAFSDLLRRLLYSLLCGNTLRARSNVHKIISLYDFLKGFSASPIQYLFFKKNLEGYYNLLQQSAWPEAIRVLLGFLVRTIVILPFISSETIFYPIRLLWRI